jgi:hypothetical protein
MKEETTIFQDFMKVQASLETIAKNSQGYNYKYADLPKIWAGIKDLITKQNFIVYHEVSADGVKTTAEHISGKSLTSLIPFSGQVKPQDRGSEITYYKRYNIMAIFNIVVEGEDDDGAKANKTVKLPEVPDTRTTQERSHYIPQKPTVVQDDDSIPF